MWRNPASIDTSLEPRAVTFENPTGARGAGGVAANGRKGAPYRIFAPGEAVDLVDIAGPGCVNHVWLTIPPDVPERMRGLVLEVFYDEADEPSIAVPVLDFFGCPMGRPVDYSSALTAVQEARGYNSTVPMPFRDRIRIRFTNATERVTGLYFQVDLTLGPQPADLGYLHVPFRRQNPTVMYDDFVIADGLRGPGRFLGCVVGIRPIDTGNWYGEGEVKIYLDGDDEFPTICGTGLEDYVGTAWGMGPHAAPYSGSPLVLPADQETGMGEIPDWVGFYRWHVVDPISFRDSLSVTIQQIGEVSFRPGQEAEYEAYRERHPAAGPGWITTIPGLIAQAIVERVDDYSAAAFIYCTDVQPVPRVDVPAATADLARLEYERPTAMELQIAGDYADFG